MPSSPDPVESPARRTRVGLSARLTYAAERIPRLEINASFYSLERPSTYAARHAAPDVTFAVKGPWRSVQVWAPSSGSCRRACASTPPASRPSSPRSLAPRARWVTWPKGMMSTSRPLVP